MALESISAVGTAKESNQSSQPVQAKPDVVSQTIDISEAVEQVEGDTITSTNDKRRDQSKPEQYLTEQQVSSRSVQEAVKRANNKMTKTRCEFSYNEDVNRVSITVFDNDTDEVIREIPPEESLKMLQKLWEIAGLMVDEKR